MFYSDVFAVAGEMAQWAEALTAKSDDPSLIPGCHMAEGENGLRHVVL